MIFLAVLAGCGRIDFDPLTDAGTVVTPRCDPQAPFTSVTPIDSLNTTDIDGALRLTADETVAYWHTLRSGSFQLWTASRASRDLPFENPTVVEPDIGVYWPTVTSDQLTLLYSTNNDIKIATRGAVTDAFPAGVVAAGLDSTLDQNDPFLGPLGTAVYFTQYAPDGKLSAAPWPPTGAVAQPIAELDTPEHEFSPVLSDDERVIYFSRYGASPDDIFMAIRDSVSSRFSAPVAVAELNTPQDDGPTWLSGDLCRLYFQSDRNGTDWNIYLAERQP